MLLKESHKFHAAPDEKDDQLTVLSEVQVRQLSPCPSRAALGRTLIQDGHRGSSWFSTTELPSIYLSVTF